MQHTNVTRMPKKGEPILKFLTKGGDWSTNQKQAYNISEEDAKVFVRTLARETRDAKDKHSYDYTMVED